jgi:hypothetical protein
MPPPMYIYRIFHRPASRARALINGVPVYDRIVDQNVAPAQPITHWLVSGDNTFTFELAPTPRSPNTPLMGAHFAFMVQDEKDQGNYLFKWEYPLSLEEKGLPSVLPLVHTANFHVSTELPTPAYAKALPEEFPEEGTPELRAAVFELHDAFARRDAAQFESVMDVKVSEFERYYTLPPLSRHDAIQQMNAPWIMEPFNEHDLRFDRYLDGRLAKARRASGKQAVRAEHRDEPGVGWGSDFFMTRVDGRWRIYW